jgi:transcription antitermination factor NusG
MLYMSWYVLYTKTNNEKVLASNLERDGYEVYCPLYETIRQWSDRKKKVRIPLFKSFIFIFLNSYEKEKSNVLSKPGAVRFLWWLHKPCIVRVVEIEAIREFLNDYRGAKITISLLKGDTMMINDGPLAGHSGELRHLNGNKATLIMKSFGYSLVAEVPTAFLSCPDK